MRDFYLIWWGGNELADLLGGDVVAEQSVPDETGEDGVHVRFVDRLSEQEQDIING